ncbi:Hypothetical_protein [Hexamita inflata]|uniref:Hypothetical_protein n=1 Tax=Hexamita inflata TaxID=28002 RepID=A0AA86UC81_9EUKA|nr:Hypothetical protein HINF_LOCUS33047 [Hexamita inflata]
MMNMFQQNIIRAKQVKTAFDYVLQQCQALEHQTSCIQLAQKIKPNISYKYINQLSSKQFEFNLKSIIDSVQEIHGFQNEVSLEQMEPLQFSCYCSFTDELSQITSEFSSL